MAYIEGDLTEQLYGGEYDGQLLKKSNVPQLFCGMVGDGKVRIYIRKEGRLTYIKTVTPNDLGKECYETA